MVKNQQEPVRRVVLTGNTAMQLIFSNGDLSPLASYPFHTDDLGLKSFNAEELDWPFPVQESILFFPSIGSFVGSDILAGIAASGMHMKEEITALIDLGTNGEIVVGNMNSIVCASTAAGPAFEGANISMGMRAVTGAISSLRLTGEEMVAEVIGRTAPKGICGSALIDAIAILRKTDRIGMFGEINSGEEQVNISGAVSLTQRDINEFQLAKAAIAAGLDILTRTLGIQLLDIGRLYIAGGFGSYINIDHVVATGMIEIEKEKIHIMGNTSLIGAKMFLFTGPAISGEILPLTRHINLEGDKNFQDIYVDKMLFL
jgi:uncharacterized 2Fe-2S/4Fe-4S cluster protein (DUF4445 family)